MKKISTVLIALLIFTLLLPTTVFGSANGGNQSEGSLTIHKYEQEPGANQGVPDGSELDEDSLEGTPLKGVTYTVEQTHSYSAELDRWTEIQDGSGNSYTETTDSDGLINLDLSLGRYKIHEIDGPDHVNLNEDEFFVDIPMTNEAGMEVNYNVHIYPKNETIRNDAQLTKVDGDTEKPMKGVKFKLFEVGGEMLGTDVTDKNGKILAENLPYGDYYFQEVKTLDGYVLGDQRIEFSVTDSMEDIEVNAFNFVEPGLEKEVSTPSSNRGEEITYSITSELPGDIHTYKSYVITDELDENLSFVEGSFSVDGVAATSFDFYVDGQNLEVQIRDFSAFEGVEEVTIHFDALISEEAPANEAIENEANLEFENQHHQTGEKGTTPVPVLPTAGTLEVIKVDGDTEETLQGAEFELKNLQTEEVFHGSTDENGVLDFGELDYGEYELTETKAPTFTDDDGVEKTYNKLNNPIEITIDEEHSEETITVDNFKSGWELPQTGGIGTSIFTLVGLLLMGAATYLYFRRRPKDA